MMSNFLLLAILLLVTSTTAFAPVSVHARSSSKLQMMDLPPVAPIAIEHSVSIATMENQLSASPISVSDFTPSSTMNVGLVERKAPTKEEIEAKKRNFAFWFWGGGFVAPFLATFYYFGFKFWEK